MSSVVYGQGDTATHRWVFQGPAILTDPVRAQTAWERVLRTGLQSLMQDIKDQARAAYSDAPTIRDGFTYTTQTSPYVRGQLIARADKFPVVELPTRPHTITAVNVPYLVFPIDGHWVRVKSVNHPGTKGRRAIEAIFEQQKDRFLALCDTAVEAMLAA